MALEAKLVARLVADNRDLTKKLNQSKSQMRSFQSSTAKISKAIQANFTAMLGGAALASAGRFAIQTLANFEFQMDKVAAVSGATSAEMKDLTRNAKELGARSKFTATEIGKLQEEYSRLGFAADDIINLTDATRQLATVADSELGESAKVVGNVINAFGLETAEAGRIANTMAESFSKSALDLEKFSVAMSNVGANAKAFGLTVEETTAYLGALVDAGIDASKAGTDLRTILIESNKSGLTLNEAFDKIRNSTDKLGTSTELFGKRAGAAGIILAENRTKVDLLTASLSDSNREMEKMTGIMEDNLLTDFAKFRSALEGLVLDEGSKFNGFLRGAIQNLTELVGLLSGDDLAARKGLLDAGYTRKEIALMDNVIEKYKEYLTTQNSLVGLLSSSAPQAGIGVGVKQFGTDKPTETQASAPTQMSLAPLADAMGLPFLGMTDDQYDAILASQEDKIKGFQDLHNKWKHETDMFDQVLKDGASAIAAGFAEMAITFFNGGDNVGKAIVQSFGRMMSQIGFKYIEAGALFFANSLLAQAGTGGFPNPLSIHNQQMAVKSIGIGAALGATGGILNRISGGIGGGAGGGNFGGAGGNVGGRQTINLDGQFRVRGSDLVYVLNREQNITGRTG